MMPNEKWRASGKEDASNKTIVAALHKYIVKHCKSQQYQMSEATWRNFCLKVADSLCNDDNNQQHLYDCNKIINYVYNNTDNNNTSNGMIDNITNNINDHSISYNINDFNNSSTPNTIANNSSTSNNTTSNNNNNIISQTTTAATPQVWIHRLKYFLSCFQSIFSSTELCAHEPSYLVRSNVHLTICKDYLGKDGCHDRECRQLHCCKYFIYNSCKFADGCSYGHDINTGRNKVILESYYIFLEEDEEDDAIKKNDKYHINNTTNNNDTSNNNATYNNNATNNNTNNTCTNNTRNIKLRKQIRYLAHYSLLDLSLILQHDFPRICRFYNNKLGCKYGGEGKKCPALHICRDHVMGGTCCIETCPLNHTVHSQQMTSLLARQGFVVNEYTKDSSMLGQLRVSEEAAEVLTNVQANNQISTQSEQQLINSTMAYMINQSTNQLNNHSTNQLTNHSTNQLTNHLTNQSINQLSSKAMKQSENIDSISDSVLKQYNTTPSSVIPSQYNNPYNNNPYNNNRYDKNFDKAGVNYDDHNIRLYDRQQQHYINNNNNTHPYDNINHDFDNMHPYDNIIRNTRSFYGREEAKEDELYNNEVYNNNTDILYNTYNTEELQDDTFPPIFYPKNYLSNNNDSFQNTSNTKDNNNNQFFPSHDTTTTPATTTTTSTTTTTQSALFKSITPMTLRQQHLRQRKRIDNSRLRVCKYYNVERGCKFLNPTQPYCPNLHLCHHFVAEKCIYGNEKCRRSHSIHDASVVYVLKSNNIDLSMSTDAVLEEIRRRLNLTDDSFSSDSETDEDQHPHLSSPFTTRSTLTPTACEFTPSKGTTNNPNKHPSTPQSITKNNYNAGNKNTPGSLQNQCVLKSRSDKISTFVFLDLEATGFHQSKITELSLVAVHRSSIEATIEAVNSDSIPDKSLYLPRIINKLTICVNPGKPIERRAAEITGMSSSMLDTQGGFSDHTADLILLFIHTLQPPCCLVAHNGRGFDFPLLRHELSSINRHAPYHLYCVDSLVLFRSLCAKNQKSTPTRKAPEKTVTPSKALSITSPNGTPISIVTKVFDSEDRDDMTSSCGVKLVSGGMSKHLSSSLDEVEGGKQERIDWWGCSDGEETNHLNNHHDNKISPTKLSSSTSNLTLHTSSNSGGSGGGGHNELATAKMKTLKARTDWWESEGDEGDEEEDDVRVPKKQGVQKGNKTKPLNVIGKMTNGHVGNSVMAGLLSHDIVQSRSSDDFVAGRVFSQNDGLSCKKKLSYKLSEIHKRVTGEYPHHVHRAEDDSEALLRCFIFTPGALQWADHNAIPFTLPSNNT